MSAPVQRLTTLHPLRAGRLLARAVGLALAAAGLAGCANMSIGIGLPIGGFGGVGVTVGGDGRVGAAVGAGKGPVAVEVGTTLPPAKATASAASAPAATPASAPQPAQRPQ